MLKTILQNRRLCNLLSPYFTPNASPSELVVLYEEVVTALHADSGDVIFMLLTKVHISLTLICHSCYNLPFPLLVSYFKSKQYEGS